MQDDSPLISVIVPIYNVGEYVSKCIDSIIRQTYRNIEIILVDDGSTDKSGEICDLYSKKDKRIVVIHKKNGGLSDARNAGIDVAKGQFITLVDGDDYIDKDYVSLLYETLSTNSSDISVVGHKIIRASKTIIKCASRSKTYSPKEALKEILYDREIDLSAWGKLYDARLFKKIRFPVGRIYEDSATTYRLFDTARSITAIPAAKYNYIIRASSITNESFNKRKFELLTSTREMCEYIKNKYPTLEKAANRRMMWAYISTLAQLSNSKDPKRKDINSLMNYIKKHRNNVLADRNISKRDRFSLLLTKLGFRGFRIAWRIYRRGHR